ncbi:MAG: DUF4177 domain-containing protein [Myxococcaceae bacterium]
MKRGFAIVVALFVGAFLGACFRDAVKVGDAHATATGQRQYKVVGGSISTGGYEDDMNKMAAEGWHYVGAIPVTNGTAPIIFER